MPYYKKPDNSLIFYHTIPHPGVIPSGAVAITDAEAAIIGNFPSELQIAKTDKINGNPFNGNTTSLVGTYTNTIQQPISFTTIGKVVKMYQTNSNSISNLQATITGCTSLGKTPIGFYWVAEDNTQVPFTLADLNGLATAIFTRGVVAFQTLQDKKALVNAAVTITAVQAVT